MYWSLVFTLVLGTPLLSLVGAIAVALTVGLQRGGVLLSLLLLPVFIPLLIFATSAVESAALGLNYLPQIAIIGAMLCFAIAITPFAISYAIRVSHH
jgi:heme exporter protein B